jgi:pimeloyl-ACP methyl ester carboxylesterase
VEAAGVDGRRALYRVPEGMGASLSPPARPALLIHGLGCSSEAWSPLLSRLARDRAGPAALAPDLPGYGRSPGPPTALSILELAAWCARFMDALAIPRADLAGHSLGGQVALTLAARYPARVGRVLLIGPTLGGLHLRFWREVAGVLADTLLEPWRYKIPLARMYLQMGPGRYFATIPLMHADDAFRSAVQVVAPTLVVRGSRDPILPVDLARGLAAALPDGEFLEVPGATHAVQFSQPEAAVAILRSFFAGGAVGGQLAPVAGRGGRPPGRQRKTW